MRARRGGLCKPAKRPGYKFYGRQILITFPDGRREAHLLPATAMFRDLETAKIEFDQWGPLYPSEYNQGQCLCDNWRARVWATARKMKLIRAARLCLLGAKRMYFDGKL
ncbi:MAG: hypothetical protein ACPGVT_12580 [Maricaulaceae bacterium]